MNHERHPIMRLALWSLGAYPCYAQSPWPPTITRVNVGPAGLQANAVSWDTSISADGRFVALRSLASNLVQGDTNNAEDVFVHDIILGTTERVSLDSSGTQGTGGSYTPDLSDDGRYVTFASSAENLVVGDSNGVLDIFVRDRLHGTTERVSVASNGGQALAASWRPSISGDGRLVAFESDADNITLMSSPGIGEVFIHDRLTGFTSLASLASDGTLANGICAHPDISTDGTHVAFESEASNLVPGDTNGRRDVFLVDLTTGSIERVSVNPQGVEGDGESSSPSLSADASCVAFHSHATNFVQGDMNGLADVFLKERATGATLRMSVSTTGGDPDLGSYQPSASADGSRVAFFSYATNLVSGPLHPDPLNVYIRDWQSATTYILSVGMDGGPANWSSQTVSIAGSGQFTAFTSAASNLVPGDTNGFIDIFVHEPTLALAFQFCSAKQNSLGCVPAIGWTGTPSATATTGFLITATKVLNAKAGILIYSTAGSASVVFKGGTLCVSPPIRRTSVINSGGTAPPNSCDGLYSFEFNAFIASGKDGSLIAGQAVWSQFWSRDQGYLPPNNIGLTDAVAFLIQL